MLSVLSRSSDSGERAVRSTFLACRRLRFAFAMIVSSLLVVALFVVFFSISLIVLPSTARAHPSSPRGWAKQPRAAEQRQTDDAQSA